MKPCNVSLQISYLSSCRKFNVEHFITSDSARFTEKKAVLQLIVSLSKQFSCVVPFYRGQCCTESPPATETFIIAMKDFNQAVQKFSDFMSFCLFSVWRDFALLFDDVLKKGSDRLIHAACAIYCKETKQMK